MEVSSRMRLLATSVKKMSPLGSWTEAAGGEVGGGEAGGGVEGGGGGGLEDELRSDADAGEIDEIDDGVAGVGDGERAEADTNLLRGELDDDGALVGIGQSANAAAGGDQREVFAGDTFGDDGDGLDVGATGRGGEGEGLGDGVLDVDGAEADGIAGGETLGEGGRAEEGEQHEEEPGTHCRERTSVLARVSVAQRDSHHSSNKGRQCTGQAGSPGL